MQENASNGRYIPASAAAVEARCSREALIRKIQTGELAGRLDRGRWVVQAAALADYVSRASHPEPVPAA